MCKKLIYFVSFILVLSLALASGTKAADPNLVGWWPLNEGSGTTVLDSSGNDNNGTIFDNVSWADGKTGLALEFDGVSGHVEVPHSESLKLLNQGDFTIAAWCQLNEVPPTTNRMVLQQGNRNGTGRSLLFINNTNEVRSFAGGATTSSGVGVEAGVWTHLAVTVTEGGANDSVQLYVNGEPAGEPTPQSIEDCEGDYFIGSHKNLNNVWDGLIDDLRLYNKALTELEMVAAMEGVERIDMEIGFAIQPPVIDGEYDGIWAAASTQSFVPLDDPANASGSWKVLYDSENLYVMVDITDDSLQNDSASSWQDDSVEVYFDGGNTKVDTPLSGDDHQYTFAWTT
ncbi:MAG: LamG-like jellyroll fold domain-containing protein, partial [Planctomycetota bacterium]